jgi:thiol-disulfide isomerase/thioredoxin
MRPRTPSRRALLAAGAACLAGCAGTGGGSGDGAADEQDGQPARDGNGDGESNGASESTGRTGRDGPIVLRSVEAPGSPGDEVRVREPGTTSVVEFFATWCGPCKPQMAELRELRASFGPDELHLVSVTQETRPEKIRGFWERYDGTWPALVDEALVATDAYDVGGLPTTIVLDPDGAVAWRHVGGPIPDERLAEAVRSAAGSASDSGSGDDSDSGDDSGSGSG